MHAHDGEVGNKSKDAEARLEQLSRFALPTIAPQSRVTHVTVTGYTDTTGSVRHHQILSDNRAAVLNAEPANIGIRTDQIETVGGRDGSRRSNAASGARTAQSTFHD
jgi:outer membrane protein OmpA-like peptidoglycan-associated protein